jgi:hypothetical protein
MWFKQDKIQKERSVQDLQDLEIESTAEEQNDGQPHGRKKGQFNRYMLPLGLHQGAPTLPAVIVSQPKIIPRASMARGVFRS